ncbi:MAG: polyprenyl synthetase family protein [Ignavibacteria bacterium]|nr:polyprenyl synthetase family protein [Ignavibacteria bacterium]
MLTSEYNKRTENYKKMINERIFVLLKGKKPKALYDPIRYFLSSGGKRIRPLLLIASAGAVNRKRVNQVINQAVAVELLHNFTLIHDDIMDNSSLRHGKKTLHEMYDVNTAILSGDNLLALAFNLLNSNLHYNENKILHEFSNAVVVVCEGQSLDKEFESLGNVTLQDYLEMIYKKTASMLSVSCKIGALCGDAPDSIVSSLSNYGKNLGLAFQIQDDLLDMKGDNRKFGKTLGSDLTEGKKTFLLLSALQRAKGKDSDKLTQLIKNKGIRAELVDTYFEIYKKYKIDILAKEFIQKYVEKAVNSLNSITDSVHKDFLNRFANQLLYRTH